MFLLNKCYCIMKSDFNRHNFHKNVRKFAHLNFIHLKTEMKCVLCYKIALYVTVYIVMFHG